ncbi:MAG TPA: hypothetical protein VF793_09045, partial [Telluria sp.]
RYRRRVLLVLAGLLGALGLYWRSSYVFAYTWVRGHGAHAAGVATDNPLNSLVFGIDRSAKHSKIIDTRMFQ